MKLISQVIKDLRRELLWLALYGVLAGTVFLTLPGLIGALNSTARQQLYEIEEHMRRADLSMIMTKSLRIGSVPDEARADPLQKPEPYTGRPLRTILEDGFSREGKLGSYAIEYDRGTGQPKYVYFVGRYVDLAPVKVPEDCDYYICCSEDAGLVGRTVTVFGEELPVTGTVPADATIYHPAHPYSTVNLKGALFVFIRDYESLRKLFWYSHSTFVNDNLIAIGADEEELSELTFAIWRENGEFAYAQTMEEYLGASTQRMQAYTSILFRLCAIFALAAAMVMNISRAIRRWGPEYSIHCLFGASQPFLFLRMLLFGLGCNLLPLAFIWYRALFPVTWNMTYFTDGSVITEKARGAVSMTDIKRTAAASAAIVLAVLAVCIREFIRFRQQFSKGMRGE
ncbi:MAG: hypothetical protein IK064_05120 [Clostridia bacterium]|nr:hypothetical protein [Clostridia bacterium]